MWPFSSSASPDSTASTSAPIASSSSAAADRCPVDETTRQKWLAAQAASGNPQSHPMAPASSSPAPQPKGQPVQLSTERETSTIPRFSADSLPELASPEGAASYATPQSENWVYPSQDQFYRAMERKNHNPRAEDMQTIVPIHNAVNERAWKEVLEWEKGYGGEECGGIRLMTFRGTPGKMTPKSFLNQWVFGYQPPFDTHRWKVNRCGAEITYIIDFYTGRAPQLPPGASDEERKMASMAGSLSFFLDVRPAVDGWEGLKMRLGLGRSGAEKLADGEP